MSPALDLPHWKQAWKVHSHLPPHPPPPMAQMMTLKTR